MPLKKAANSEVLAYVAGIIDGEGCIRLGYVSKKLRAIRMHVTNTDRRLIDFLHSLFGGYVWEESGQYLPNAKIRFVWEVSSNRAAEVIEAIQPFLRLKAEQAAIALKYQQTKRGYRNRVSDAVRLEREILAARLKILNKKGTGLCLH